MIVAKVSGERHLQGTFTYFQKYLLGSIPWFSTRMVL